MTLIPIKSEKPLKVFTRAAIEDMLMDLVEREGERTKPMHQRGKKEKKERDEATDDADEDRVKTSELASEMHGEPTPVELDDEDFSDEGTADFKDKFVPKKKKPVKKSKKE
jgi:hypothetical protein